MPVAACRQLADLSDDPQPQLNSGVGKDIAASRALVK